MFESPHAAADSRNFVRRPARGRSRLSNDLFAFSGDGRSSPARRFRDIAHNLIEELGGHAALDEPSRLLIRQAATLTVRLETLQAQVIEGGAVNDEDLVRIANVLARTLGKLRQRRRVVALRDAAPSLADIVAEHKREGAE